MNTLTRERVGTALAVMIGLFSLAMVGVSIYGIYDTATNGRWGVMIDCTVALTVSTFIARDGVWLAYSHLREGAWRRSYWTEADTCEH